MNLNTVKTEITVDGTPCDYVYMTLHQSVSTHHTFEIAVSYRHEKKSVWGITVHEIFRTTLNKPVTIKMTHMESGKDNVFEGIVTDIKAVGVDGDKGTVILRGGSPTLLLDRDPSMDAFTDYNLYNVVAETLENSGVAIKVENAPWFQQQIPYIARYRETSYAFLSRILAAFGEWFYYDGKKLVVGRPGEQEETWVMFDVELSEVESMARMLNLNAKYYDYDPSSNNHYVEDSGSIGNANLPMKAARQVADSVYTTPAMLSTGRAILSESDMSKTVRTKQSRQYVRMSKFKAKCSTCAVKVGEVAIVTLPDNLDDVFFKDLGSFLVTEITHSVDKEGQYTNTFTGIAGQTETLPDDHIVLPQAFQEPAIVVANGDPKNQGRVKVRFFWQPESESSNWIRVQTPDAGKSDIITRNHGFVFIPEIDDQVMIGYQDGDPSRPYVMGSLFHRDNSKGAASDNNIKAISTKSGHVIEFNDDNSGEWGITIKDENGNCIQLDTVGQNIKITAPETMTLSAKNINIEAQEDMSLFSGSHTKQNVGKDYIQNISGKCQLSVDGTMDMTVSGEMTVCMDSSMKHNVSGSMEQKAEMLSIIAEGGTASITAKDELTLKSATEVIIAQ